MSFVDWSRMLGQDFEDENWRSRSDIWHYEATAKLARIVEPTVWTPTVAQPGNLATIDLGSHYSRVGSGVTGNLHVQVNAAGAAATQITCSLPIARGVGHNSHIGSGYYVDATTGMVYPVHVYLSAAQTAGFILSDAVNTYLGLNGSFALAAGVGDTLSAEFSYNGAAV